VPQYFSFFQFAILDTFDVSCSELNDVLVMTVGDQSISEFKACFATLLPDLHTEVD
jgi:hypothetical protein